MPVQLLPEFASIQEQLDLANHKNLAQTNAALKAASDYIANIMASISSLKATFNKDGDTHGVVAQDLAYLKGRMQQFKDSLLESDTDKDTKVAIIDGHDSVVEQAQSELLIELLKLEESVTRFQCSLSLIQAEHVKQHEALHVDINVFNERLYAQSRVELYRVKQNDDSALKQNRKEHAGLELMKVELSNALTGFNRDLVVLNEQQAKVKGLGSKAEGDASRNVAAKQVKISETQKEIADITRKIKELDDEHAKLSATAKDSSDRLTKFDAARVDYDRAAKKIRSLIRKFNDSMSDIARAHDATTASITQFNKAYKELDAYRMSVAEYLADASGLASAASAFYSRLSSIGSAHTPSILPKATTTDAAKTTDSVVELSDAESSEDDVPALIPAEEGKGSPMSSTSFVRQAQGIQVGSEISPAAIISADKPSVTDEQSPSRATATP